MEKKEPWIKRHKKLFIFLCIMTVVTVAVVLLAVRVKKAVGQAQEFVMNMTQLSTTVERMDLVSSISVTGKIASADVKSVTESSLSGKKVSAIYYEVGDYVEAGTLIMEFDAQSLQEDLDDTTASTSLSDKRTNYSVSQAYDNYVDAQNKYNDPDDGYTHFIRLSDDYLQVYYTNMGKESEAQSEYDKEQSSYNKLKLDDAKKATEDARKLYKYYLEEAERLADAVEEARYQYEVASAEANITKSNNADQVDSANEKVQAGQIVAPISGVITAIGVEEGDSYDGISTLVVIQDNKNLIVTASVDEYDIASLSKGLNAVVKTDSTGDTELNGELTFVAPTPSSSTVQGVTTQSNSYAIEITLNDQNDSLRIGMTAKTSIILESAEGVLAVPYDCVQTHPDGQHYVMKINNDGTKTEIPVTIGMENDYYQEIIGDGITEGMEIESTASSSGAMFDMNVLFSAEPGGAGGDFPGGDFSGGPGGGRP